MGLSSLPRLLKERLDNMFLPYGLLVACLLRIHCASSHASAASTKVPGFRTALTSKGLDYICQVGVPILEKELSSLSIPDISGSAGTPIGTVDYHLTQIQLSDLKIPTSSLTSSSTGLDIQASDLSLHVFADWQYRKHSWPHIEGHGTCDVDISEVTLQMHIAVAADSTGHANLSVTFCHLSINDLHIDFHGGDSWLYNLFSKFISDDLKGSLDSQVCSVATREIETKGNQALASIPVNVKIDSTSEIDFALIQNPTITTAYVEMQHKGEFYNIAHPVEAPFIPPSLPPVTGNTSMLYMWLTDYMADTAGFVYQTAGLMHYTITPNMVPPSLPFHLNTSSFRGILPQLYNKFPNWNMELVLNATKPPLLTLTPTGGTFFVFGDVLVYVIHPGNSSDKELAFVLGATVYANATFYINTFNKHEMVCGNTTFLKIDLSLVTTNIGIFSVDVLQEAANLLSTLFIIPSINHYANTGIPIPTVDGLSIVTANLVFGKDYVVVAADIKYM
jgi:lipopolysaccharide-binding protein